MTALKIDASLLSKLRGLIERARPHIAQTTNSAVPMLF